MEKLLEQEALMEQQDPKVRSPGSGDGLCEGSVVAPQRQAGDTGKSQTCTGSLSLPSRVWELGKWRFVH